MKFIETNRHVYYLDFANRQVHPEGAPIAFLDRDGVVNVDRGYVHDWKDFTFSQGSVEAMRGLNQKFELVLVTNQSGIARGLYTINDFQRLSSQLVKFLGSKGVNLRRIYFCPHLKCSQNPRFAMDCSCRKPESGMIEHGLKAFSPSIDSCILVGDKLTDIQAGTNAGIKRSFLVGRKSTDGSFYKNLLEVTHSLDLQS